jgi:hypothetical protein
MDDYENTGDLDYSDEEPVIPPIKPQPMDPREFDESQSSPAAQFWAKIFK